MIVCSALLGFTSQGQPSVEVGINVPLPSVSVEIHAESDFYQPLAPQGEWVVVGSYGRCWRPSHVERDWRPYCNGRWQQTEAGWYWASDEPWAWATYHYGRWDFNEQSGWFWMPQTQWAPAWVSWHSGGGYVGWAPLQPSVSISVGGGFVGFNESRISPHAFVFVKEGGFMEPIRPGIVVVNNTTIIKNTVVINNTKIVNNRVIIGGPSTAVIERASGRKVQVVAVQELRHKEEAPVAARQRAPLVERKAAAPVRSEAVPVQKKPVATHEATPVEKPVVTPREPAARVTPGERQKPVSAAPEARPEVRPEVNHPAAVKEPIEQKSDKRIEKQEKPTKVPDKKNQRPAGREKPAASQKNEPNPADKEHENKPKQ